MPYSDEENEKIVSLYLSEKFGIRKIAKHLKRDYSCVRRVLLNRGIRIRGSRNFTDSEEAEIAKIYLAGASAKAIARAYGLSHHISICAALKRQNVETRSLPERNRLYALNPYVFDSIDCEEAAYFLGLLYADGGVNRRSLVINLKRSDEAILHQLCDFLESESPVRQFLKYIDTKSYPQSRVEFTDRHLADKLRSLGILPHRPNFYLAIDSVPQELMHHFLRGFWDGDGSAASKPTTGIGFCGREDFMMWIRGYCADKAGTNPNLKVYKHPTANLHYLRFSGRLQALKVFNLLFVNATVWLKRKRDKIEGWPPPQERVRDAKGRFT